MLETLKDAEKALIKMKLGLRKHATQCQKTHATVHDYVDATLSNEFNIESGGEIEGDLDSEDKEEQDLEDEEEQDLEDEEEQDLEEEDEEDAEVPKKAKLSPKKIEPSKKSGTIRKTRRVRSPLDDSSFRFLYSLD
ncbi:PREDICTED: glutamic acid-rich protein-like [Tarenaya hassleriana]|uniref:glutamic acid-rich protein-like n=1 Tax=Tarenaya hassleriana TaxID=28532 RepID=UPI0008FCED14|nr:PREDICTED: glutamic acid-rich protein-like [Tarenaya hassleriana]